jgi:hypothetical protein
VIVVRAVWHIFVFVVVALRASMSAFAASSVFLV